MILSALEQTLLIMMIFFLMIGIGSSLEISKIIALKSEKKPIFIALLLQYLLMPAIALGLSRAFNFTTQESFILLLITCCPGGTTSNMFSYFAGANVELSIALTTITTTLAFVMTPILLKVFGMGLSEPIIIPYKQLILILSSIFIPVVVGFAIKSKSAKLAKKVERAGSIIGGLTISIMVVIWTPKLATILKLQDSTLFLAIGATSALGVLVSYLVGKTLRLENQNARAISLETGIQNAPLAFAIVSLSFPSEIVDSHGWIPLVYGALSVGVATFYLVIFRLVFDRLNSSGEVLQ